MLFGDIATIMGAGNFIGHATSVFTKGISHIPFIIGEQGSKIIFALVIAGFAGKFTYITVSDLMYDLPDHLFAGTHPGAVGSFSPRAQELACSRDVSGWNSVLRIQIWPECAVNWLKA